MGRFSNSMALAKSSWGVLKADKELAVIPVASFVVSLAVIVIFGGAFFLSLNRHTVAAGEFSVSGTAATSTFSTTPLSFVVGALGYLCVWFVVTFFTGALVAGAHERLTGGDPTLGSAFAAAWERFAQLMGWSALSGVVGLIIQQIERQGILGAILGNVADIAWRLCTWLAIPVIMIEGLGAVSALKRSGALFKRTWGENVIAQMGFGLLGLALFLPGALIGGLLFPIVPVAGVVIFGLWAGVTTTIMASLNGIFRTALYMYAAGQHVHWFDEQTLSDAFRPKTSLFR